MAVRPEDVKSGIKEKEIEAIKEDFERRGLEREIVDAIATLGRLERLDEGFSLVFSKETAEKKTCRRREVDIAGLIYIYEGGYLCFNRYDEHKIPLTPISKARKLGFTNLFFDRDFRALCFVADHGEVIETIKFYENGKVEEEDERRQRF